MERRTFLAAAGVSAASYRRVLGANDRIGIGIIGIGNIGVGQHIRGLKALEDRARIVAVCDIYTPRLDRGITLTSAKGYHAYEDLIADPNVDAVIVATPDHWHAKMAIDAMRAGKDVDVEKPMCLTIDEAKEMVRVARQTGRVLAVDSEHMAHGIWKPAAALVGAGVLGQLLWSQTSRHRNSLEPPWNYAIDKDAGPGNLDWDRWLGSRPKVPYSPERYFRWRRFWDYGGGITTDLYYHHITPLIHVTGRGFPVRAVAAGGNYVHPVTVLEVPDTFVMTLDFENRHTMVCGGSLANSVEVPIVIRGHRANIRFFGPNHLRPSYLLVEPEGPFAAEFPDRIAKAGVEGRWVQAEGAAGGRNFRGLPRAQQEEMIGGLLGEADVKDQYDADLKKNPALGGDPPKRIDYFAMIFETRAAKQAAQRVFRVDSPPSESFHENFLRSIRTREKPVLDGELGYRSQVAVVLGVEAWRRNKVAFFDPKREIMVDAPPTP